MRVAPAPRIDLSGLSPEALLKLLELEWQDHIQTRIQTWKALQMTGILAVALVGMQWKSSHPLLLVIGPVLLVAVALFGIQITLRHRNTVEVKKFGVISKIEEKLGLGASDFQVPFVVDWWDILNFRLANTSLFLLRMQFILFAIGLILLALGLVTVIRGPA